MAGPHKIRLRIAGVQVEIASPLTAAELGIETRLGDFFADRHSPAEPPARRVRLDWEEAEDLPAPPGDLFYDPGSIWKLYRDGADSCASFAYPMAGSDARTQGVLRANSSWDNLRLVERRKGQGWRSLLNTGAGELVLRTAILFAGGLVFHSAGVDDNGKGLVFLGHSGAGKSTQAELWRREPGVTALNDDRVAVCAGNGAPWCCGTPWGGGAEIACNHAAPLAALIVLEQAPENAIERIEAKDAAPLLAARAFLPYWDGALMARALANLDAVLARVPVYRLRCRPERAVLALVRSVL